MNTRWRAAAMLAAVACLGLLCASCDSEAVNHSSTTNPPTGSQKPTGKRVVFVGEEFETIRIEAEAAEKIVSDKAPDGQDMMRLEAAEGASSGKCLYIPDKTGTPFPEDSAIPARFASAVYRFKIEKAGLYTFWCRRKWCNPPQCGDTFAIRFDMLGKPRHPKTEHLFGSDDMTRPPRWAWSPVYENGKPRQFFLAAGEHVLELLNREDGPRADVILLTNDRDYVPQGMED